jgi:hypothetical protein
MFLQLLNGNLRLSLRVFFSTHHWDGQGIKFNTYFHVQDFDVGEEEIN